MTLCAFPAALLLWLAMSPAWAAIQVSDDSGRTVRLERPARRVLALSPHTAELAFAAGLGDLLVGAVAHADYPPAATRLPRVGDAFRLDREALLALAPDLVLAWPPGNPAAILDWLERRGIPIYRSDPQDLKAIAGDLEDLGWLTGRPDEGAAAARAFRQRLAQLRKSYAPLRRRPRRLFYQLWERPLMTLGRDPLLNEALGICGLTNVFRDESGAALPVSREAVLQARPEVILSTTTGPGDPFAPWRPWKQMPAVRAGAFVRVPPDLLQRPTPRLLDGIARLCQALERLEAPPPAE